MTGRQMEGGAPDPSPLWIKFPDGGSYIGPVSSGLAHGLAVTVGPRGAGEFSGLYQAGYETLGVLRTSSGETNGQPKVRSGNLVDSYSGEWSDGRRHGLGVDSREGWVYKGEWTQGFRGRYGVRQRADTSVGYEGTWTSGVPDGFGVETYADGSWYCGQWMKGMRYGYGVRQSSTYQNASKYRAASPHPQSSMTQSKRATLISNPADNLVALRDQKTLTGRGGFILLADTTFPALPRKRGLLLDRHGRPSLSKTISHQFKFKGLGAAGSFSRSSSIRSVGSRTSGGSVRSAALTQDDLHCYMDDDATSFISQDGTSNTLPVTAAQKETYLGEWKDDRRNGYGVCLRSDGLKYEGEWMNNQKHGYGCTTLPNGTKLSGKYRNNVLVLSSSTKSVLAPFRGNKINDRTSFAVDESQRAAKYAKEKEEIARIRMKGARERALLAEGTAARAVLESEAARSQAARFMSANQSTSDIDISMHRPSEREFYMEIDPADRDFSFASSQSVKKKRFPLPIGRSRTGSLSAVDESGSGLTDFVSNERNQKLRPQSQFETLENSEFVNEPTLVKSQYQPSNALQNVISGVKPMQPPTYTFETTPQPTVNRLSSVPVYNHYSEYEPTAAGRTRRKSLPSIVKEKIVEETSPAVLYDSSIDPDLPVLKKSVNTTQGQTLQTVQNSVPRQNVKRIDTYIIENGVRKLVKKTRESPVAGRRDTGSGIKAGGALSSLIRSSFHAASAAPRAHVSLEEQFNDMYKTESPESAWKKGRGSIPDITTALGVKIPPREEVYVLSQRRREEIIQERAQRERIRKNHIVVSFIDMKRWFTEHILLVLFICINVLLAVLLTKS